MFTYQVKTEKNHDYFTVVGWGGKAAMLRKAEVFDAHPDTIESRIVRDKDKAVIYEYHR